MLHFSVRLDEGMPEVRFELMVRRSTGIACLDRQPGEPVPAEQLKSFQEMLAQYHLHLEARFDNGEYLDRGIMHRRHLVATVVE